MSVSPTVLAKVTVSPTLTWKSGIAAAPPWARLERCSYTDAVYLRRSASRVVCAHHAVADERRNLGRAETKLAENLPGLRAEPLRRQAYRRRLSVITHGVIDQGNRRAGLASAGNRYQRLHVPHLCILEDLFVGLHAGVPDLRLLHAPAPFVAGFRLQPRRDEFADLVLPGPGVVLGERGQPRLIEDLGERRQRAQ